MAANGVDVVESGDGSFEMSSEDQLTFDVASYVCAAKYFVKPSPPPTAPELDYTYTYLIEFLTPCLEAHGQTVPTPISREAFVSEYPNQHWYPGPKGDAPDRETILKECPLRPPGDQTV